MLLATDVTSLYRITHAAVIDDRPVYLPSKQCVDCDGDDINRRLLTLMKTCD